MADTSHPPDEPERTCWLSALPGLDRASLHPGPPSQRKAKCRSVGWCSRRTSLLPPSADCNSRREAAGRGAAWACCGQCRSGRHLRCRRRARTACSTAACCDAGSGAGARPLPSPPDLGTPQTGSAGGERGKGRGGGVVRITARWDGRGQGRRRANANGGGARRGLAGGQREARWGGSKACCPKCGPRVWQAGRD